MMSHRAQSAAIMHATLPVGDMHPRSPSILWAAGWVVCATDLDVVCAVIDGVFRTRRLRPRVLIFDFVRPPGLVAQWESVRLTRGRSLVRNQPGPPQKAADKGPISRPGGRLLELLDGLYRAKIWPKPSALVDRPAIESVQRPNHILTDV